MADKGNAEKYEEILKSSAEKICVIAGPGSGKTKGVLIPRAKQIISDSDLDPKEVLILSFSRMSAQDLKGRIKKFDKVPRASTLHSFCLAFLLSENNHDIRKRIDSIVMDFEKRVLISDLKIIFPALHKSKIKEMLEEFSAGWAITNHDEVFIENDQKKAFKAAIVNWLCEHEAAMMEEVVYNAVDLAKKISSDFINNPQYIFVDEFQDLNKLEQEFISLLSEKSKLVLALGDPDQSIYSFKYAHPDGINEFSKREDVESHTLVYCGRCARKILNIANQLLKQLDPARKIFLKPLPTANDGFVSLANTKTQVDEFNLIIKSISSEIDSGTAPSEILVLMPKKKLGIEFVKFANTKIDPLKFVFKFTSKNEFSVFEQERILLLGIIANPASVLRMRTYLGLMDKNCFAAEFCELKKKYGNLKNAVLNATASDFNKRNKKIILLCGQIKGLRESLEKYKQADSLDNLLDIVFPPDKKDFEDLKNIFLELKEESDNLQNLYSKFIDYSRAIKSDEKTVKVMNLIASKGLDAECVYIAGCNQGNIPGKRRTANLTDYEYKQEQKRLLFVGITRAKEKLYLSWSRYIPFAQSMGQRTASIKTIRINGELYSEVGFSEFLQDIDFKI